MSEIVKENKMGIVPIPKLLMSVSLPIIISMIVQAMYNVVDSIFVAGFDNIAGTGALTLAFPIQGLLLAVSIGFSVGTSALLSRSLGQKKFEKTNIVAGQGFFLMFCGYLLFFVFALFFVDPFVSVSDDGNALLHSYAHDYISIISFGSIAVFIQVLTERLLQSTGKSMLSMITQLSGAITNIILDPILIFGVGAIPSMGVKGAAVATVIGQCVSACVGVVFNLVYNTEIKFKFKNFLPRAKILKEILEIAIPTAIMQAIGSVMTFSMNLVLNSFGIVAMNVFGIYFKLQSFVFMPVFGLNNGMIPIVAYNYGAEKKERVYSTMKIAVAIALGYMALATLVFQLFPEMLLGMFNANEEMVEIGKYALRIISIGFLSGGFSVVILGVCQALGKSIYSLIVSLCRQLVVLVPAAFLLSMLGEVAYVWWAFPLAELINIPLCFIFISITLKKAFSASSGMKSLPHINATEQTNE